MSLLYFHVFLISTASVFGFYFGWWQISAYLKSGQNLELMAAVSSVIASFALLIYLFWFIRKNFFKKGPHAASH